MAKGHPRAEVIGEKSHLSVQRWESAKHRRWGLPVEELRSHVATDDSLREVSGRVRVGGQLCSLIMTRTWVHCMGFAEPGMLSLRDSAPSGGLS